MRLIDLQRDLRAWLTEESAAAAARLGGQAAAGLPVYLNNYRSQLLACLTDAYSAVHAWTGDAAFNAAAARHIDAVPPSSWTLDAYARGFPDTLAALHPDDPEIGELALLERALSDAFVASDCPPLALPDPGAIDWDQAILTPVPTLTLLPARTNAAALCSAISAGAAPPPAAFLGEGAAVAVWRSGFTPMFRTLERDEATALGQIAAGTRFGELCAGQVTLHGEAGGAALAGAWLGQWLRDGLIAAIR